MADDDFDIFDSDEAFEDEVLAAAEPAARERKGQARRRYDRLVEERRLKQQLEDDIGYW